MNTDELTHGIIGAAIEVHRRLGPGLLESAYQACLAYELQKRGFEVVKEQPVPVIYDDCLLYTSPSPRDATLSRMPSSA